MTDYAHPRGIAHVPNEKPYEVRYADGTRFEVVTGLLRHSRGTFVLPEAIQLANQMAAVGEHLAVVDPETGGVLWDGTWTR